MTQFSSLWGRLLTQEIGSEDSTVLFTDARRKAGVNDGIQEFADLTECYVRVSSLSFGAAEVNLTGNDFLLPGDFVRLAAKQSPTVVRSTGVTPLTYVAGLDFPQVDVAWLNRYEPGWQISTVGSLVVQLPRKFYLRPDGAGMYFGVWPTPSAGSSGIINIRVPYVARPEVMTSDSQEPFSVAGAVSPQPISRTDLKIYHRAAVHYAAHQMEKLRRDEAASDRQLQRFLSYVTRYTQSFRQKGGTALTFARTYFRRSIGAATDMQDPRR